MHKIFIGLTALLIASPAMAASPDDARLFIQSLDRAISESKDILNAHNPTLLAQNSHTMKALEEKGRMFGNQPFDEPYGNCYAAGVSAQNWWKLSVDKASAGKENLLRDIAIAAERYQDRKTACLSAADDEDDKQ